MISQDSSTITSSRHSTRTNRTLATSARNEVPQSNAQWLTVATSFTFHAASMTIAFQFSPATFARSAIVTFPIPTRARSSPMSCSLVSRATIQLAAMIQSTRWSHPAVWSRTIMQFVSFTSDVCWNIREMPAMHRCASRAIRWITKSSGSRRCDSKEFSFPWRTLFGSEMEVSRIMWKTNVRIQSARLENRRMMCTLVSSAAVIHVIWTVWASSDMKITIASSVLVRVLSRQFRRFAVELSLLVY